MHAQDIAKIIETIDDNAKIVGEFAGTIKNVLAKDPHALEDNILEHTVRIHFGDSMYEKVSEIYKAIIGT